MKKFSKLFTLLLAVMMLFTTAKTVSADPFDYTKINGGSTKLKKYLVVDKDTNIPGLTFEFTVAPGAAVAAANGKLPVYAGTGTPTIADVAFTANEAANAATATEANASYTNKIAAKKDITINFSSAEYDKPGIYRYVVTETASTVKGVVNDPESKRTIDVYVEDKNGTLEVTGYVSYLGEFTAAPAQTYTPNGAATDGYANGDPEGSREEGATKSNKYVNEYQANELTLEKEITGNQGDKESTWEMKVNFETLPEGYNVKIAKIAVNGAAIDNPTYSNYENNSTITLGHKDKYDFKGIPEGVKYTVTETKANQDGYTTTYTNQTATFADDGTVETKDAKVVNNRNGVIPTGVMTAALPGALLVAGAALYFIARRRNDDEE